MLPTGHTHAIHTIHPRDTTLFDTHGISSYYPHYMSTGHAPTGYTLLSTVCVHGICNPRDILKYPRDTSTGDKKYMYPRDMSCCPRDRRCPRDIISRGQRLSRGQHAVHGIPPQDYISSTGYTHGIYQIVSRGYIPWTYPVDYISRGFNRFNRCINERMTYHTLGVSITN